MSAIMLPVEREDVAILVDLLMTTARRTSSNPHPECQAEACTLRGYAAALEAAAATQEPRG